MGVRLSEKSKKEVIDLLINSDFDSVEIAYQIGASIPAVNKFVNDLKNRYHVKSRELLVECLEQDVY